MNKFDEEIKKMAGEVPTPASYDEKVNNLLQTLEEKAAPSQMPKSRKKFFQLAACLLCVFVLLFSYTFSVRADIFASFKETILDFLMGNSGEDPDEIGIGSGNSYVESQPDLFIEMTENVIDSHSIYLLLKITAPGNTRFGSNVTFDYFCFCKGQNYNPDHLLSGAGSCELLEINEERPNIATYVVSLTFNEEVEEGSNITFCCRDLTADPYTDHPTLLVGGVWSLTFPFDRTIRENIKIEGTPDMSFPYINTTAKVMSIELTPLSLVLVSDVSNFPADELGVTNTTINIRLKMIDGSDLVIISRDPEKPGYINSGGQAFQMPSDDQTYQQDTLEFAGVLNLSKILGIYIEDLYIPLCYRSLSYNYDGTYGGGGYPKTDD